MSTLEVQAGVNEVPTTHPVERYVPRDVPRGVPFDGPRGVPAPCLAPLPVQEDGDIPPGTAGRAAALGL